MEVPGGTVEEQLAVGKMAAAVDYKFAGVAAAAVVVVVVYNAVVGCNCVEEGGSWKGGDNTSLHPAQEIED